MKTVPSPADLPDAGQLRRARLVRRVFLTFVFLVVVGGVSGAFGVRGATRTVTAAGDTLTVLYPSVARAGLAVPYGFDVVRPGGFDGPVTVAVSGSYLQALDQNAVHPQPASATTAADGIEWEFDPPSGNRLRVRVDARIEPGVHWPRSGWVAVMQGGEQAVRVSYRTWILP